MLIEASITAGIRPTSMILHTQPRKRWDEFDFLCIEAHQIVLSERCAQCGYPRWLCHNEEENAGWKAVQDVCFATREVENKNADKVDGLPEKQKRGMKLRVEPFRYDGKDADPDMRANYYKTEYEKANPES